MNVKNRSARKLSKGFFPDLWHVTAERGLLVSSMKPILLAEDSEQDIELTLAALEEHGLANDVVVVRGGAETMDYLNCRGQFAGRCGGLPVLVLLDLKMPKVDGLDVLRQMKTDPVLKSVPVVILTSSREEQDLVRSYELGVNAYVVKPVDFQQFADAVKTIGCFWALINQTPPVPSQTTNPDQRRD